MLHTGAVTSESSHSRGVVKFWKAEKGWGAISSPDLPEGKDAFAVFSVIDVGDPNQYRSLIAGESVEFTFEAATQDSFEFRATWVRAVDRST
jgi:CspA family cold shock protein